MSVNNPNYRPTQAVRPSSAQRRADEHLAVAGKQAQLKQEAADRAAARAQRDAEQSKTV